MLTATFEAVKGTNVSVLHATDHPYLFICGNFARMFSNVFKKVVGKYQTFGGKPTAKQSLDVNLGIKIGINRDVILGIKFKVKLGIHSQSDLTICQQYKKLCSKSEPWCQPWHYLGFNFVINFSFKFKLGTRNQPDFPLYARNIIGSGGNHSQLRVQGQYCSIPIASDCKSSMNLITAVLKCSYHLIVYQPLKPHS